MLAATSNFYDNHPDIIDVSNRPKTTRSTENTGRDTARARLTIRLSGCTDSNRGTACRFRRIQPRWVSETRNVVHFQVMSTKKTIIIAMYSCDPEVNAWVDRSWMLEMNIKKGRTHWDCLACGNWKQSQTNKGLQQVVRNKLHANSR